MSNSEYILKKYGSGGIVPFSRNGLYSVFRELSFKIGCEVGVRVGKNASEILLNNPQLKLYLVDMYRKDPEYINNDRYSPRQTKIIAKKKMLKLRARYDCNYKFIVKCSKEAVKEFEDESLDFVYIDANHKREYVKQDLQIWSKKVKPGGIISGHDYCRAKNLGVRTAVNNYVKQHGIKPFYLTRDIRNSFFWVKR